MDLDAFWQHIDRLDGSTSREAMRKLEDELAALPAAKIEAFGEILAGLLYALDTREHFRQEVSAYNGGDIEPQERTSDLFRDLRCAVVIAGRARYDAVRAEPAALGRNLWPEVFDAVRLIDVLDATYQRAGLAPAFAASVGIETGSNPAGPSEAELEAVEVALGWKENRPWMRMELGMEDPAFFQMFIEGAGAWQRFDAGSLAASTEVFDDGALQAEFQRHGVAALDVELSLLPPDSLTGVRIRRRGDRVEIELQTHYELYDGAEPEITVWTRGLLRVAVSRALRRLETAQPIIIAGTRGA